MADASLLLLWFISLASCSLVVVIASVTELELERLRRLAVVCASLLVVLACLPMVRPELAEAQIPWPRAWGPSLLRTDALSDLLLPMAAGLWLLTVAVTPRMFLDREGLRRNAIANLSTMLAFASENLVVLTLAWVGSVVLYRAALARPEHQHARRVATVYLGTSTVLFVVGVGLLSAAPTIGVWLVVGAVLIRKGIFPVHAWVPELFERGALGPAVMFSAPQIGAYATAVIIVPRAGDEVLRTIAILALVTAVYGAALALIQRDARRTCGYLFVSQSALIMAGLDCTSEYALAGSLMLWLSSSLAFAGISRAVLVLEARRGRMDLTTFHGGYQQMPMLAIGFLVLGLACVGFPGTLGFIGQELLVSGATESFPFLGFFVVAAGALTGLAMLRMYFSLFCGRPDTGPRMPARKAEIVVFGGLSAILLLAGLRPAVIVRSAIEAAEQLVEQRDDRPADSPEP